MSKWANLSTFIRVLARAAYIEKVDSGPAAIAFTPHAKFAAEDEPEGVEHSNGRLLLRQAIGDPIERLSKGEALLSDLAD